jgi:hypothetical protein
LDPACAKASAGRLVSSVLDAYYNNDFAATKKPTILHSFSIYSA